MRHPIVVLASFDWLKCRVPRGKPTILGLWILVARPLAGPMGEAKGVFLTRVRSRRRFGAAGTWGTAHVCCYGGVITIM